MLNEAMEKIKSEMKGNENNPYVQVVGDYLIKHLESFPDNAHLLINPEKSILKSLDEMRKVAASKKTGNFAMLTPQEGFAVVLDYYGIEPTSDISEEVEVEIKLNQPVKDRSSKVDFNVTLDEFL